MSISPVVGNEKLLRNIYGTFAHDLCHCRKKMDFECLMPWLFRKQTSSEKKEK